MVKLKGWELGGMDRHGFRKRWMRTRVGLIVLTQNALKRLPKPFEKCGAFQHASNLFSQMVFEGSGFRRPLKTSLKFLARFWNFVLKVASCNGSTLTENVYL